MASVWVFPCFVVVLCISVSFRIAVAKKCVKLDTCSCKMDDGSGIISFQSVDNPDGTPKVTKILQRYSTDFNFNWNPCTTLKSPNACKDNNICQMHITSGYPDYPAGGPDTTFSMKDNKVVMTYQKMKADDDDKTRYVSLNLQCDKTKEKPDFGLGLEEGSATKEPIEYTGTLTSKCACPGACPHSTQGSSSSSLSIGSILLIIFFPLLLMYFIIGIVVNKYVRNKEGFPDLIPNHSFWTDFPFLIKDGCVFSCGKLRYCCSSIYHKAKGDSEYAQI